MAITTQMRTDVAGLYAALFGRAPERDGLGYWVEQMGAGKTLAQVAQDMYNVDAARAIYPKFLTNQEIIGKFYSNVLGRNADADGLAYWTAKLNATGATAGSVIAEMITAVKAYAGTDAEALASKALFNNKVDVGINYAVTLGLNDVTKASDVLKLVTATDTTAANNAAAGISASTTGQAFALTDGVDTVAGTTGNDTISATNTAAKAVLGGLDAVDGGNGTDTLSVADTATLATAAFSFPTGFSVKNVEVLNVSTNGSFGDTGAQLDLTGFTGLTNVNITTAGDGTTDTSVKVAGTTDLAITASAAQDVTVSGGKAVSVTGGATVAVTGAALTSVTLKGSAAAPTIDNTDALGNTSVGTTMTSVTLDGVDQDTAIKGKGIDNLTLKNATASTNTVTITNGSTGGHALTVNVDGSGYDATGAAAVQTVKDVNAKSLTVNATGAKSDIAFSTSAANTVTTSATIKGSAALILDLDSTNNTALVTIDGSAATGNLTLNNTAVATTIKTGSGNDTFTSTVVGSTKATVDAGAGNDNVTISGALVAGSTVNLGAGNDHLIGTTAVATSLTATSVIDGGDGTDTVSAQMINAGNAALFKNFEGLSLNSTTGLDVALLTGNTIGALFIDSASTSATYQNVTSSMGLTVNYVGDNSAVTNTLTMTGVSGTADGYTITFAGDNSAATTAPVAANVKAGTVAAAGIENFTIASGGTKAWNSLTLGADTSANTVTVTGAANLDLAFAASFGSTTSPKTGVSLIDGSAATGKLNINVANVTAATAGITVKGGTAADTLTASTFATTLTGGSGNDTFDATLAVTTAGAAPVLTTITDIAAGDIIKLTATGASAFTATKVDVSSATALSGGTVNALDLASTAAGNVANQIKWFQYGGNTYIIDHVTASTVAYGTGDQVVKLVGLVDLSTAVWSDASASLTIV